MKRILLIITIILCIFQIDVLAVDIDIGAPAINRSGQTSANYTYINKYNPANASGIIDTIEIWAATNLSNCEVAIFDSTGTNQFSTRSTHFIGSVAAGSKQTFTGLNLTVETGDYLGFYCSAGNVERDSGIADPGYWYISGDYIPCSTQAFTFLTDRICSLYGTGTTDIGWSHKWNTKTISKWNTKDFTKWNGLE